MWLSPEQRSKLMENPLLENTARHRKRPPCYLCTRRPCWSVTHLNIIPMWSPRITFILFWSRPTIHSATKYSQVRDLHAILPSRSHSIPRGRGVDSSEKFFLLNFTYAYCKYDKCLKDKYQEWINIKEYFMCICPCTSFTLTPCSNSLFLCHSCLPASLK